MKTDSKNVSRAKTTRSKLSDPRKPKKTSGKNIENTDLNVDNDVTNTDVNDVEDSSKISQQKSDAPVVDPRAADDTSVEAEQDREALRKMEDNHPDEILN